MERVRRLYRGARVLAARGYADPVAAFAAAKVAAHTMVPTRGLIDLHHSVADVNRRHIPGALVECGVWRGGAAALMAIADDTDQRHLHLFDSFEGLPQPSAHDDSVLVDGYKRFHPSVPLAADGVELVPANACVGDIDICRWLADKHAPGRHTIHRGWFEDTVPEAAKGIGPIALLRLDGDFYQSTKVCLEHLYPLLSPGGVLIVDDYGAFDGCRKAVDEYFAGRPLELTMVSHEIARARKAA